MIELLRPYRFPASTAHCIPSGGFSTWEQARVEGQRVSDELGIPLYLEEIMQDRIRNEFIRPNA